MGVERGVRLEGLTEPQISKALEELVKVGESLKAWELTVWDEINVYSWENLSYDGLPFL